MKNSLLISTGGSGGHVIPATILYEHLTKQNNVIISTDKRGLKYLDQDIESKVTSIHPALIPTEGKLWIYNVKTRKLTEFTTSSTKGFEVRGSTLYNFDKDLSRMTTLRKPLDILPQILNKTERQINNLWDGFTTKISEPTGRINKDTILLRVESYTR